MEHPFISDLSDKTLEELQETLSNLGNKMTFAYRTGNQPLIHQLQMVLESYKKEYDKRISAMIDKKNIDTKISITGDKVK